MYIIHSLGCNKKKSFYPSCCLLRWFIFGNAKSGKHFSLIERHYKVNLMLTTRILLANKQNFDKNVKVEQLFTITNNVTSFRHFLMTTKRPPILVL